MILSDSVRIKMVNSVINKYRNLGYVCKLNEVIPIKIEHLPFNSHAEINVLCKICKTEKCISYRHYIKCTECKSRDYLCKKCSIIRKNKTNLKKYGVENVFSNLDIKNKIKNTLIKKYNVDNPSKSENIKNKIKHTNIEKYGHCCALHGEKQKRKTKETNLKKYGDEIYFKTEDKKIKSIITNNKKIGVDYPTQSANVREKIKKTNFKKFGVENPSQSLEIFNKARTSGLRVKKYGNLTYQGGYELHFIQYIISLGINIENGPVINYNMHDVNRKYFSDFYLPKYNLICEVKSSFYYNMHEEINLLKKEACMEIGYNFIFIFDKNYDNLNNILNIK